MDAASNRGIDPIRELRENTQLTPATCRFKIYIIDEAHMLTPEAFNALLKTLEEPPAHVIFVLATTEHHKVPLAIVSRCQGFDFRFMDQDLVVDRLRQICQTEEIEVTDDGLALISQPETRGIASNGCSASNFCSTSSAVKSPTTAGALSPCRFAGANSKGLFT